MSWPDESSALPPSGEGENPASLLDHDFNFQIVVFKVENRLFQVLRNGFNVPGTPFEAMFTLPQQTDSIEGSSLENPIHLPGIKVDHFRSFLRILYPFIGQKPVVEFDEWVGVLNLATMWLFHEIRAKAISRLSKLIKERTVAERITLARGYRVVGWLRDECLALISTQKSPLDFEELRIRPDGSSSIDWEMLARISNLQMKVAISIMSLSGKYYYCYECDMEYGGSCPKGCLCKCRLLFMVDEAFRGELKSYPEYIESPPPPNTHTARYNSELYQNVYDSYDF